MTEAEIAWLAGILEGEGSFQLVTSTPKNNPQYTYRYYYPHVILGMTDEDVVARVAELFGSSMKKLRPYGVSKKSSYRTKVTGAKAVVLMKLIRPYMGKRRQEQIDKLLNYEHGRPDPNVARSRTMKATLARKRAETS